MTEHYEIRRGLKNYRNLTPAQRTSSAFAEEPVVMGKVLRRGVDVMKISPKLYEHNRVHLRRLEQAGAIVVTRIQAGGPAPELIPVTPTEAPAEAPVPVVMPDMVAPVPPPAPELVNEPAPAATPEVKEEKKEEPMATAPETVEAKAEEEVQEAASASTVSDAGGAQEASAGGDILGQTESVVMVDEKTEFAPRKNRKKKNQEPES